VYERVFDQIRIPIIGEASGKPAQNPDDRSTVKLYPISRRFRG
jgi:hypothetical protein